MSITDPSDPIALIGPVKFGTNGIKLRRVQGKGMTSNLVWNSSLPGASLPSINSHSYRTHIPLPKLWIIAQSCRCWSDWRSRLLSRRIHKFSRTWFCLLAVWINFCIICFFFFFRSNAGIQWKTGNPTLVVAVPLLLKLWLLIQVVEFLVITYCSL